MYRSIEKELKSWKTSNLKYPLLLRGARQVGKTFVIEKFGSEEFDSFEKVNFEAQPEAAAFFESLDPTQILQRLEIWTGRTIRPGKTLLFLDEIQACPKAILALRYFKEKIPELHVIGAGSLLEFTLMQHQFSFPVGRVQFIYMKPLSFEEFASALGHQKWLDDPSSFHEELSKCIKEYAIIGGMPAAVQHYFRTRSILECSRILDILLSTYRADFGKYATEAEQKYLRIVFESIGSSVGQQIKFSKIDPDIKSRELKSALDLLEYAGLIHRIYSSSAAGIPLAAQIKRTKAKPLFLDIGLLQRSLQTDPHAILEKDLHQIHAGALAEQFVGQELLAYGDAFQEHHLFFWEREKQTSDAEVDYVISLENKIMPIEVKAGGQGKLKSLHQFMSEKKSPLGIRISPNPLSYQDNILSVPFYMIGQIPKLVKKILS